MPFKIIRNDITRVRADAIVNTANPKPCYASGTDAAIYQAAGAEALLAARRKIGDIAPGEAAVTPAFDLPAKYLIHTVGPNWIDGRHGELETLRSCYRKSLLLAEQLGCQSIAFPLIATGVYGFPKDEALSNALQVIEAHLQDSEMDVTLVVFDRSACQIAATLIKRVEEYIDENYVSIKSYEEYDGPRLSTRYLDFPRQAPEPLGAPSFFDEEIVHHPAPKRTLEEAVSHLGESFQARLLRMIDERSMTDPEVYKRANIDRKLFSKIRCSEEYSPRKKTIMALAIALKLNLDDARDLLMSAGYTLTNSQKADVIVSFCLENGVYDIFEVNALLFKFGEATLS